MKTISVAMSLSALLLAQPAAAQPGGTPITTPDTATTTRPILIPLAGSVRTSSGEPRTGQVMLHLALYASESDREPLATEDQLITLGAGGAYHVWFGATFSEGLPAALFTESAARWLGITIDQDPELPRTAIVTVPYAARAASADALGTRTASDFVLSENLKQSLQGLGFWPTRAPKTHGAGEIGVTGDIGILSTTNSIAKFINSAGALDDAAITESGGTVTFGNTLGIPGKLHISGTASDDLFSGMGPNLASGPAMNFGYAGGSIGRSAGFFNVRPDSSAVPPNPSLRFMTANQQRMIITNTGDVGIGTLGPAAKLHVAGNVQVDGNIAAKYQDVAEWVDAGEDLAAGTVVVIDPEAPNRVRAAAGAHDTTVAGAVSLQPGIVLGEAAPGRELVAQSGRVRVKVDATFGAIRAGDLLVTSPTPGHAMRSVPLNVGGALFHRPGTILGKALESLDVGRGEILVLLTLQ